jgi:hypothetical protein
MLYKVRILERVLRDRIGYVEADDADEATGYFYANTTADTEITDEEVVGFDVLSAERADA